MDRIGEDLLLLLIRENGTVAQADRVPYALMGAELVRLAATARVNVQGGRIVVLSNLTTGDPLLDVALSELAAGRKPPHAKRWVSHPRHGIRDAYLNKLAGDGVLRREPGGLFGTARWRIVDRTRLDAVRRRLDAIAGSASGVTIDDSAFAGLAHAAGIGDILYPGWGNRSRRRRLEQIAKGEWTARAVAGAAGTRASVDAIAAATDSAVQASTHAAIDAAISASTQAAVDAAVQASITAATDAVHHHSHDGGAAGHH